MDNDTKLLEFEYLESHEEPRIFTGEACGFPSFCSLDASVKCLNISLSECGECSMVGAAVLLGIYVIMGVLIVVGNGFTLYNVWFRKNGFDDTYGKIRGSLALADIIAGE